MLISLQVVSSWANFDVQNGRLLHSIGDVFESNIFATSHVVSEKAVESGNELSEGLDVSVKVVVFTPDLRI